MVGMGIYLMLDEFCFTYYLQKDYLLDSENLCCFGHCSHIVSALLCIF